MDINRMSMTIANQAYILDCLVTLRSILDSGCCNDCSKKMTCEYAPKPGELVRYNCPFYERKVEKEKKPIQFSETKGVVDNGRTQKETWETCQGSK